MTEREMISLAVNELVVLCEDEDIDFDKMKCKLVKKCQSIIECVYDMNSN
jgi:hypothetical protein